MTTSLYKYINETLLDYSICSSRRFLEILPKTGEEMPDFAADYNNSKRKVIACATVIEEMLPFLPDDVSHEVLDFGLHLNPAELKKALQAKIEQASAEADILLLGYGLCSMAVIGLQATTAALVIPRTDDCIAIFLGSSKEYKEQAQKEPGTYYLTKGWIEVGDTPFNEHQQLIERYGQEKAERMTKLLLKTINAWPSSTPGTTRLNVIESDPSRLRRSLT